MDSGWERTNLAGSRFDRTGSHLWGLDEEVGVLYQMVKGTHKSAHGAYSGGMPINACFVGVFRRFWAVMRVVLFDDAYNTIDHVVAVLLRVLGGTVESAIQMMAEAHNTGQAIIFTGGLETAELVRDRVLGHAPCDHSPADCEPTRLIASLQKAF